jgi:hypothetical protein
MWCELLYTYFKFFTILITITIKMNLKYQGIYFVKTVK